MSEGTTFQLQEADVDRYNLVMKLATSGNLLCMRLLKKETGEIKVCLVGMVQDMKTPQRHIIPIAELLEPAVKGQRTYVLSSEGEDGVLSLSERPFLITTKEGDTIIAQSIHWAANITIVRGAGMTESQTVEEIPIEEIAEVIDDLNRGLQIIRE